MERNKCVLRARTICFPFLDRNNSNIISKCIFTDRVVKCKIIFSEPAIKTAGIFYRSHSTGQRTGHHATDIYPGSNVSPSPNHYPKSALRTRSKLFGFVTY